MRLHFSHLGVKKPCGIGKAYILISFFVLFCFQKQLKLKEAKDLLKGA